MQDTQKIDIREILNGLDEELKESLIMFFEQPEHGTPDSISKEGCLALTKMGFRAWNSWREKFPSTPYGHFDYKNIADFSDTDFRGMAWQFGGGIWFHDFKFGSGASFKGAKFPRYTSFDRAVFGESSDFSNTFVDARSSFKETKFLENTKLESMTVEDWIDFDYAELEGNNSFAKSSFGHCTRFNGARFGPDISFNDCFFRQAVCFETIQDTTKEKINWTPYDHTSDTFNAISFKRCLFKEDVSFKNREFRDTTTFDGAVFGRPPIFFGCTLHQDMCFKDVTFPRPTGKESSARAYRHLRLSFGQLQAPHEEQLFFRLEMAEIAKGLAGGKRWLFLAYEKLSCYGSSISRPLMAYLISFIFFSCVYGVLSWATHCLPDQQKCSFDVSGIEFSILQAIPLPGLEKMADTLKTELISSGGYISLVATLFIILQKSISILLIFLIGLALRNTFRIK